MKLSVSVLGIKINILPKKPKKYDLRKYTLKKIAKRDKKAAEAEAKKAEKQAAKQAEKKRKKAEKKAELKRMSKAEIKAMKAKKKASRPPILDMVKLFAGIAKLFFSTLLAHFHIHVARIKIKVGGPDAAKIAMTHTYICAAMHPVLMFLDKYSNLHGMKKAEVWIEPDFLSEKLELDLKLGFSMNLFGLFCVIFKVAFRFLVGWIRIKPTPPSDDSPVEKKDGSAKDEESKATPQIQ